MILKPSRALVALMLVAMVGTACTSDEPEAESSTAGDATSEPSVDLDLTALGLWDDGPCDESLEPLRIGITTVFESPVLSLVDQVDALEASATAFNARGGANGACIEVHACDDQASVDQSVQCARELDEAGVVATINDQANGATEYAAAMAEAGIPRVASNVTSSDWNDQNAYPLDASGFGLTFLLPAALAAQGVEQIGLLRVEIAAASALVGLLGDIYDDQGISFPYDVGVAAGTTDYLQYILAAQDAGATGVVLALGEQEAVQVVRAAEQLDSDLRIGASLGTFPHSAISQLGDISSRMDFVWSFPPATFDLPVYEVLRSDLAASGNDSLAVENLKASPMRSWIGLYALIRMLRDAGVTEFDRAGISAVVQAATDVPMLGIFGGEDWTPDLDRPGLFQRAGINRWASYAWDPDAPAPDGLTGNFVETGPIDLDAVLCGSPFGAPEPC